MPGTVPGYHSMRNLLIFITIDYSGILVAKSPSAHTYKTLQYLNTLQPRIIREGIR